MISTCPVRALFVTNIFIQCNVLLISSDFTTKTESIGYCVWKGCQCFVIFITLVHLCVCIWVVNLHSLLFWKVLSGHLISTDIQPNDWFVSFVDEGPNTRWKIVWWLKFWCRISYKVVCDRYLLSGRLPQVL